MLRLALVLAFVTTSAAAQTVADFMDIPSPLQLTAARAVDRIAWTVYDRGLRNVYTAAAPDFRPVRLTSFLEDNGIDVSDVQLSDDGALAVFIRGSAPNRDGWVANPPHDPDGQTRAIWAVRTNGGDAWEVAEGASPALSPDGRFVVYVKEGQIYRAPTIRAPGAVLDAMDRGERPFITAWGTNSAPRWSPDGRHIAFVSNRRDHAYIALYDVEQRSVRYVSPSVDFDGSPTWSPDGKRLAFTRRPGTPFGQQSQPGSAGLGNPPGPAYVAGQNAGQGGRGGGGGRGGAGAGGRIDMPGLYTAALPGGYTLAFMVHDLSTGTTKEVWHNDVGERVFTGNLAIQWAATHLVFPHIPPGDEFERWFSVAIDGSTARPVLLTTTDGLIEDATSAALSADGTTLFYCTNAQDIERRHIWSVPVRGGTPRMLTKGDGIETFPQPLASGRQLAVLYFGAKQPASVGVVPASGGETRIVYPELPASFPKDKHVVPQIIKTRAADGMEISNQLFLPADLKPGEKRPALVFVHGGPVRQMLPGYHYMQFYHWAYGYNQYLASQGYIVLSINFRGGIGYGRAFRNAPGTNLRGNSEYQDVLAGAAFLQQHVAVDPQRIAIWGLSYGGLLTSQALARNSDIFVAGADLAGVHLYAGPLDTTAVSYKSSAISAMSTWKSPVFLVHGDDDRNVDFAQTVGLVQLLRAHGVYHEMVIVPDDLHESMIHSIWIDTWERMTRFFDRFVKNKEAPPR